MDVIGRIIAVMALSLYWVAGLQSVPANAACLPGQSCWQVPQLQNNPPPSIPDHTIEKQMLQDRAAVIQNQQQQLRNREQLRTPPATTTPLDRIQQRQQLRDDRDQLLQSQRSLQQSQQLWIDQHRPPAPTPYVVKPFGVRP
jgi:hypothetical protein